VPSASVIELAIVPQTAERPRNHRTHGSRLPTPAEAQSEANILLTKNPPADVISAIGVLVTAADGLSGAELSLDRDAAADTVTTWAESVC
jgi:hypothetical protein